MGAEEFQPIFRDIYKWEKKNTDKIFDWYNLKFATFIYIYVPFLIWLSYMVNNKYTSAVGQ